MKKKETPTGPIRDQLDAQIAGANEHRISPSEREKIRRFVDATRRSFLISMIGGPIGDQPSQIGLRWQADGKSRVATVTALTEKRTDGRIDLLLRDCPKDLHVMALLAGRFELPNFPQLELTIDDRNIESVSQQSGQQKLADEPTFSLGADSGDEADDIPIDHTSGHSLSINWPRGERPKVDLAAGPNHGPFFGVLEARWNSSTKACETSGLAIQKYMGHGQWRGQTNQIRPIDATTGRVLVRPIEEDELHLLDSLATGDELSPLTELLAVQEFDAFPATHHVQVVRLQGLPADTFISNKDVNLQGLSVTVPFEDQSFESWWSKLAPRVERQLRSRIRNDSVLKMHMVDDLLIEVACVIAEKQHDLIEIYQLDGKDGLDGYIYSTTQNMANGLYRKLTGKLKGPARNEVSYESFGQHDDDAFSIGDMFEDSYDPISDLIESEARPHELDLFRNEYLKFLNALEREIVLQRESGTSRDALSIRLDMTQETIRDTEIKAKHKLETIHQLRQTLDDGLFSGATILTDHEFNTILSRRLGRDDDSGLSQLDYEKADAKAELIIAAKAIYRANGLAKDEVSTVRAWLGVDANSNTEPVKLVQSISVERLCRLAHKLQAQILLQRYAGKKRPLQQTGETYLKERVLKDCDWPTTLERLRQCKNCLPSAPKPVDPLTIPAKVKTLWNKNSSLVPKEFRQFDFAEALT